MDDFTKTKKTLVEEITELRQKIEEMEKTSYITDESDETLNKYMDLVNTLPHVIFESDLYGNINFASDYAFECFGYTKDDMINGLNILEMIIPEEHEVAKKNVQKLLKGEKLYDSEHTALRKDGSTFPISINAIPIIDVNEVVGIRGSILDITKKKKIARSLTENEEKFRTVFHNIEDPIFIHEITEQGKPGLIIEVNDSACKSLGYTSEEFTEMTPMDIGCVKKKSDMIQFKDDVFNDGCAYYETQLVAKDGIKVQVELNSHIFMLNNKKVALTLAHDISKRNKMEYDLKESKDRYKKLTQSSPDPIFVVDFNGKIIYANDAVEKISNIPREELKGKTWMDITPLPKDQVQNFYKLFLMAIDGYEQEPMEIKIPKDNDFIYLEIYPALLRNEGKIYAVQVIGHDISERKLAEQSLMDSEEKFRQMAENIQEVFYIIDNRMNKIIYISPAYEKVWGRTCQSLYDNPKSWIDSIHAEDREQAIVNIFKQTKEVHISDKGIEYRINRPDGEIRWIWSHAFPVEDKSGEVYRVAGIAMDITERKLYEDKIKQTLNEKDAILREVHHRVKNNMQIISSLLNLQLEHIDNKKDVELFKESQNRVKSMALIHGNLYQSENLSEINFNDYTQDLLRELLISHKIGQRIKLKTDVGEDVILNIETSIPCGLIINELATNSLVHGFPDEMEGEIYVGLSNDDNLLTMTVSDNGVGFPEELEIANVNTMGLYLVKTLVGQLDGTIDLNKDNGTEVTIKFKELEYKERV